MVTRLRLVMEKLDFRLNMEEEVEAVQVPPRLPKLEVVPYLVAGAVVLVQARTQP